MSELNEKEQKLVENKKKTEINVEYRRNLNEERAKIADLERRLNLANIKSWSR